MTVGKDVSLLFTDVLKCMITNDLELKKLVYLYLMNYAKSQPDLAILAVNSFVKDTKDTNPLIRSLAIRTMSSIRVEEIVNYLCEPLRKSVKDEDPYVRKTAAICIAKLYDVDPEMVEDQGFLDELRDLLADSNPMVVANAVAALTEIAAVNPSAFELNDATLSKLLAAINECTEWGQIFILDALVRYTPHDSKEAESIIDRISARLQHANSGVVLSSVKVILRLLDHINDNDYFGATLKKIAPSLVTLLNAEPEVQYVALRNMIIILQKQPHLLADKDIRVFICKYNDPVFVKMEKLEIMIMLANEQNVQQVLQEFKDSAQEVDVDFVRKAVRAIGRTAIKLEPAADRCVQVLVDLIQTKVSYVVQEAIVVIKDIFRKYPNRYESVIGALCENLDTLDEPDAKASLFWIIGEYADRIDNADEILEQFCENFAEEAAEVQLQLLSAVVKLAICDPDNAQELLRKVLALATQADNPDLRDRAYVYWRLLSTDYNAARDVVLAEKPVISGEQAPIDKSLLETLVANIATLASVFHKPPESFVSKLKVAVPKAAAALPADADDSYISQAATRVARHDDDGGDVLRQSSNTGVDDLLGGLGGLGLGPTAPAAAPVHSTGGSTGLDDLLGSYSTPAVAAPTAAVSAPIAAPVSTAAMPIILAAADAGGLELRGSFGRQGDNIVLNLQVQNRGSSALNQLFVQFNVNTFGLAPISPAVALSPGEILPGGAGTGSVALAVNVAKKADASVAPTRSIQIAVKSNSGVFYCATVVTPESVLLPGAIGRDAFLGTWRGISEDLEQTRQVDRLASSDPAAIQARLGARNIGFVARPRSVDGNDVAYYSAKLVGDVNVLVEVTMKPGSSTASVAARAPDARYIPLVFDLLEEALR
eukprot:TRINITY_DN13360_c0_g1_i1.p1 TRINITY_DN13360_c0_g1~~TRINITY_DN13360_c0_g1_i1.p1  ORF type:complete len:942 (-),score=270.68 TRINITY_DN13360_c0_g1_i1:49-2697(-)